MCPIANRDLDGSQQREQIINYSIAGTSSTLTVATGVTLILGAMPYAATISAIRVAAYGLSGAPTLAFTISRFIAGSGLTAITGGATTLTLTAFGTSGIQSVVLASAGSSLLQVQAGDMLCAVSGGSNSGFTVAAVAVVTQPTQDIKNHYSAF